MIIAVWAVGGAIVLLLMALATVMIARGMDKPRAQGAKPAGEEHVYSEDETDDAQTDANPAKAKAKAGGAYAGLIAIVLAVGGAGFAIVKDVLEPEIDVASLIPEEIAAGELHGTLLSPKENARVVLIVPGSGPTDRDGNNPLGVAGQPYKLLAEALAKEGIASVRVDKRGMFGSAAAGDPNAVSVEQYAEDYRRWIDMIRERTGRPCVFLLGHSEGALMVAAAAVGRKDVCALILVSGPGRKMGDILREQLKANPANASILDQALAGIAELEAGRHVDVSTMHPALMQLFAPPAQDFLISMMHVDPVELLNRTRVHKLVVQGTNDLQITMEDANLLNRARNTKLERIGRMNHVLKRAPEDHAGNMATYADATLPLHPDLAEEIADFVRDPDD
jgi:uncharacterized protein